MNEWVDAGATAASFFVFTDIFYTRRKGE